MFTRNLFQSILLDPLKNGADECYIVSGYATSAMVFHHVTQALKKHNGIKVHLIVGMSPIDGIAISNHTGFNKLMLDDFKDFFECNYLVKFPPVHSKVYAWTKNEKPLKSFIGSANYTQTAFNSLQRNCMTEINPDEGYNYFQSLISETIYCTHVEAENLVNIFKDNLYKRLVYKRKISDEDIDSPKDFILKGLPHINVSLLSKYGTIGDKSGLNWGQRKKREPNQAYIRLTSKIYKSDFFPPRKTHFTILTDDNKIIIASRAQDNGKAIHTPHNNSLIGQYFRNRLGLFSGQYIEKRHLEEYGRTDVDFYKIDNENYYMDFSVL